jgi:hypothetical protein
VDGFAKGLIFPHLQYSLSWVVSLVFNELWTLCCCPGTSEVAHEHRLLTSCNARRKRDPHTGIQLQPPFLSRRQAPGHSPQSTYNRSALDGLLRTPSEAKRALGSRVLAPFRVLVNPLRDDLETETTFSANHRGLHPRGILNQHRASALRGGNNLSKALFAEMPKDEQS